MDSVFAAMTDAIGSHPEWKIHAVLVERDGQRLYEEYFSGEDERWGEPLGRVDFDRNTKHDLRSITKSVVGALVGIAVGAGAIASLDTPLVDHFLQYPELQTPERRRITLRHALSMTAGLDWNEEVPYDDPRNDEIAMTFHDEPLRYALSRPLIAEPGTTWRYNGGLTQLLAAVLQRATGVPLTDYARTTLFAPLGIDDTEWTGDLGGLPAAASGLRLRPVDLAKFASLYLNHGRWNGAAVIPEDWVRESTRARIPLWGGEAMHYGYHWWSVRVPSPSGGTWDIPTAIGNGDQRVFLLYPLRSAVTVLAGRYNDFSCSPAEDLLRAHVLPALPLEERQS